MLLVHCREFANSMAHRGHFAAPAPLIFATDAMFYNMVEGRGISFCHVHCNSVIVVCLLIATTVTFLIFILDAWDSKNIHVELD